MAIACVIGNLDTVFSVAGVDDLVIAHVNSNVAVVADDIARLCVFETVDTFAYTS